MLKKQIIVVFLLCVANMQLAVGQATHSPYSSIGVGDIVEPYLPAHAGMGGLGISNGSPWYLNSVNPALLHYNAFSAFSATLVGESKSINQEGFDTYSAGSGSLRNLAMSFPLKAGKVSTAIGLMPLTSVNYNYSYLASMSGASDTTINTNSGEGGYNQMYLATGINVFKGLSIGLKGIYVFGATKKEYSSYAPTLSTPNYTPVYFDRSSAKDFAFGAGLSYRQKLGENLHLNLGFTYDHEMSLKTERLVRVEQRTGSTGILFADTLKNNVEEILQLPAKYGFGVSLTSLGKWLVGVDYIMQDWTNYVGPATNIGTLTNREKYIVGVEFTPDANSVSNYLSRVTYRAGFNFEKTPYVVNQQQINDFGINFGWSLPLPKNYSSIDFGFEFGNRGTVSDFLIKENYIKMHFGVSFNDRWFVRPKFN